jgi:sugar lactone lactonase YvrE
MPAVAAPEPLLAERFEHPEGVVWDAAAERLLWVDLLAGRVHACDADGGRLTTLELGRPVGAVAPRVGGGLVCAVREGFALLDDGPGLPAPAAASPTAPPAGSAAPAAPAAAPRLLDDRLRDAPLRMNDGAVDPRGRFWAGSMAWEDAPVPLAADAPPAGALYRLDPDGTVSEQLTGVGISNGLGWSPEGDRCYYVDSVTGRVDAFAFDLDAGALGARTTLAEIEGGAAPDGLAVDADGCVWVALWGGWEVQRITPAGALDRVVRLPGAHVATCAFGGPGLRTLYVSVSQQHLDERARREQPGAGRLFALDVGVAGLPTTPFAG